MDEQILHVLELMAQPAFLVRDGVVTWCNHTAAVLFPEGTLLNSLLDKEAPLFALWDRKGILNICLHICGSDFDAAVQAVDEDDLFVAYEQLPANHSGVAALFTASVAMSPALNNMVSAAKNLFDLLPDEGETSQAASALNHALYRFVRLYGHMADGSQLLLHRKEFYREPIDYAYFFDDFITQAKPLVETMDITLDYHPLTASVRGDGDRLLLERAMYNLLANALAYTPKGGTIDFHLEKQGRLLLVRLRDSGEGVSSKVAPNIFECYLSRGIGDSRWGLGLGLPMSREIARLHGGSLTVCNNEAGKGATATFSISLDRAPLPLRTPRFRPDHYGPYHHGLVELSDVLETRTYNPAEVQ